MRLFFLMGFLFLCMLGQANAAPKIDCQPVISEPSQTWINKASQEQGTSTIAMVSAISTYALCVDQNTQALSKAMLKSGHYPLMGANGNFRDFMEDLNRFTQVALKVTRRGGSWDNLQAAYALLYQKQFPLLFYSNYLKQIDDPILKRILQTKRPSLEASQDYFRKILNQYTPEQQTDIMQAFRPLSDDGAQGITDRKYVYYYAIYLLQPISDPMFAEPPF